MKPLGRLGVFVSDLLGTVSENAQGFIVLVYTIPLRSWCETPTRSIKKRSKLDRLFKKLSIRVNTGALKLCDLPLELSNPVVLAPIRILEIGCS